jgi:guanylate kinase
MSKIAIVGPSGVGKTSLINELLLRENRFSLVKSLTTRSKRYDHENEYEFVSREVFEQKIQENFFLEYEELFGNYYGTPLESVNGSNKIFNIDVKGAENLKRYDVFSIMIIPPSIEELKSRLIKREGCVNQSRFERALHEMEYKADFVVCNDVFESTLVKIIDICKSIDEVENT